MVSWCDLTNDDEDEDEDEEEQGEGAERGEGGGGLSNRCVVNDLVTGVRGLGAPKCTLLPSVPSQMLPSVHWRQILYNGTPCCTFPGRLCPPALLEDKSWKY